MRRQTSERNIVVIGHGRVGGYFVELLLNQNRDRRFNVIVFDGSPKPFDGYVKGRNRKGVAFYAGEHVTRIVRAEKRIETNAGRSVRYDKVVLATGNVQEMPDVEGDEKSNVFIYRTVEDIVALKSYAGARGKAVVCGGGANGIEAARVCAGMGLETMLLERADHLMPGKKSDRGGAMRRALGALGIDVRCGASLKAFEGRGAVHSVRLIGDSMIPTDVVVMAADSRPNTGLAARAGLHVGDWGGVTVDERLVTGDPDIYAIGGCAEIQGMIYDKPEDGYTMATVAVCNLFNGTASFNEMTRDSALKGMWSTPDREPFSRGSDKAMNHYAIGA